MDAKWCVQAAVWRWCCAATAYAPAPGWYTGGTQAPLPPPLRSRAAVSDRALRLGNAPVENGKCTGQTDIQTDHRLTGWTNLSDRSKICDGIREGGGCTSGVDARADASRADEARIKPTISTNSLRRQSRLKPTTLWHNLLCCDPPVHHLRLTVINAATPLRTIYA
jgi:hypothetical protein